MSSEVHVFFQGKLPTKAALTRAMKELGFPITVKAGFGSLETQKGFMPMALRREESGVEFDVFEGREAIEECEVDGVDPAFNRSANFRWGGDEDEMLCGLCAAAALACLVQGIVYDGIEGRLLSIDEAAAYARSVLESVTKTETKHPGTRPADIKRYLKPLLEKRRDLVLFGRLLLIRPVRHLLRGAYFCRTSDKYEFRVYPCLCPLYNAGAITYLHELHPVRWQVYEPYFEPFLMDYLTEEVFGPLGTITSLDEFVAKIRDPYARIPASILAGNSQNAEKFAEEIERKPPHSAEYTNDFLKPLRAKHISELCEEFHMRESSNVKKYKLQDIWEPSPFPAEIPPADQANKCSESIFVPKPWVERPIGFIEQAPAAPGDVRFSRTTINRDRKPVLVAPLSREQAEAMHNNHENYILMARLEDGPLLVLHHDTDWSPHDPKQPLNPDYVPFKNFNLWIYGATKTIRAYFWQELDKSECVNLWSLGIRDHRNTEFWHANNTLREECKIIYDHRPESVPYRRLALSDADVELCRLGLPPFGEYQDLWRRVKQYLKNEYGEFD